MNNSSQKYDLTVGNVEEWRKRERIANDASRLSWWNPRRTRLIYETRNRGQKPRRLNFDIYQLLCRGYNRLFIVLVVAIGIGLLHIIASVLFALFSGRIEAVVESIKAAH